MYGLLWIFVVGLGVSLPLYCVRKKLIWMLGFKFFFFENWLHLYFPSLHVGYEWITEWRKWLYFFTIFCVYTIWLFFFLFISCNWQMGETWCMQNMHAVDEPELRYNETESWGITKGEMAHGKLLLQHAHHAHAETHWWLMADVWPSPFVYLDQNRKNGAPQEHKNERRKLKSVQFCVL